MSAPVAVGTQVYAARYLGPWAKVVDGEQAQGALPRQGRLGRDRLGARGGLHRRGRLDPARGGEAAARHCAPAVARRSRTYGPARSASRRRPSLTARPVAPRLPVAGGGRCVDEATARLAAVAAALHFSLPVCRSCRPCAMARRLLKGRRHEPFSSTRRQLLLAACAAIVTVGCSGGGGADPAAASTAGGATTDPGASATGATGAGTSGERQPGGARRRPALEAQALRLDRRRHLRRRQGLVPRQPRLLRRHPPQVGHAQRRRLDQGAGAMADDAEIMSTAKSHSVKVIPLIDSDDGNYVRNVMSSPAAIAAHAAAITDLVVQARLRRHGARLRAPVDRRRSGALCRARPRGRRRRCTRSTSC